MFGNGGNDTLSGKEGDDLLDGGSGDDYLGGGKGFDTLIGGSGDDTLSGKAGSDILTGGEGADTFVFGPSPGQGIDRITDFDFAEGDRLKLAVNIDFYTLGNSNGGDPMISFYGDKGDGLSWLGAAVLEGGNFDHSAIVGTATQGWGVGA